MSILDTALAWDAAGVAAIPVRDDGTKAPALTSWKQYQATRPTLDELLNWFGDPNTQGIGILTGAISGNLEMLELEGRAVQTGALEQLQQHADDNGLRALLDQVIDGYSERTPSGGLHLLYRVDGPVKPNTKLARDIDRNTLAETRGEGGFVVVAPSGGTTHASGHPWAIISGSPATIAHISSDDRDALYALFSLLNTEPPREEYTPSPNLFGGTAGTRPGDDYANKTSWQDLLIPRGWTIERRMGNGYAWRRPGKTVGISATTGQADDGIDRLYVFSSSTEFDIQVPISKFRAYTVLEHGGDHIAAARELARLGYGTQPTRPAPNPTSGTPTPTPPAHEEPMTDDITTTIETVEAVQTLAQSEDAHALDLIDEFGATIRYWEDRGRWLHWDGWRWREQAPGGGIVREYAKFIARRYPDEWKAHKRRSLSAAGTTACLTQASTDHRVTINTEALDAHPWELNTPGGIIDLRSGRLMPPDPAKLHTRITRCAPDFTADRTAWLGFLDTTFQGDRDLIGWMQRLLGYAAIGVVLENILPVFYGATGANGKTVLLDTIMAILGDYAAPAPKGFLLAGAPKHDTEIADLAGVRMIVSSETNSGERFDEGKVKLLTGGDRLKARFMRQDFFHFTPSHTVFLMSNHRPEVTAGGSAFWRRIREVPFDHQMPEHLRDGTLKDRLVNEHGPAILAWIAEGAAKYAAGGLAEPARVHAATNDYERDTDTVARFVEDVCILGGGDHVKVKGVQVRAAYEQWCSSEGETPVSAKALMSGLRSRYPIGTTRSNGTRFCTNLTLATQSEESEASSWIR